MDMHAFEEDRRARQRVIARRSRMVNLERMDDDLIHFLMLDYKLYDRVPQVQFIGEPVDGPGIPRDADRFTKIEAIAWFEYPNLDGVRTRPTQNEIREVSILLYHMHMELLSMADRSRAVDIAKDDVTSSLITGGYGPDSPDRYGVPAQEILTTLLMSVALRDPDFTLIHSDYKP